MRNLIRCSLAMLLLFTFHAVSVNSALAWQASDEEGFKSIFDGKTLDGWQGDAKLWRVENGAIVGETTDSVKVDRNKFLYWHQGEVDDFALRLKFKISGTDRANSGVQIRSTVDDDGHMAGYQADIERGGKYCGILYSEKTGRGILCQRGQKVVQRGKKDKDVQQVSDAGELFKKVDIDDWNDMEIVAKGNHITVAINGNVTADFTDEDKELFVDRGRIGLQLHVGPPMKIEFKDIRLKRLPLAKEKKVVFVAGTKSHGWGAHEHNAGCLLLAQCLEQAYMDQGVPIHSTVYRNGWPSDPTAFDNADTIVAFCDGGGRHFLHRNGESFEDVMRRGVGLVCIHYGVEVPKGPSGQRFLEWIGGYFETDWSVNPTWTAKFEAIPEHAVTQGVEPFELQDEWYYHMRFADQAGRVTTLLSTLPPESTLSRKDGPHSNNPHVRRSVLEEKKPQAVSWAYERRDGKGRGFGFTGAHYHRNWGNDSFRTLVLNAILWTAHIDVPEGGVKSATPTGADLDANQDFPKPNKSGEKQRKKSKRK
ncbi:MAG: family 16 glycoside hydrolase [Planctomycetota bacterium]